MLHLSGYAVTMDDLKQFRQIDSITPGHPENFATPGNYCPKTTFSLFILRC